MVRARKRKDHGATAHGAPGAGPGDSHSGEHALIEEARRLSEEKYRALVENINDIVFSLDTEGVITYVSPSVERLVHYRTDEVVGHPFTPFVHPDDLEGLRASLERTLAGDLHPYEFRVFAKNGEVLYVRTSSRPLWEGGRLVGLTGVVTDVTARKLAEEALQKAHAELERRVEERTAELANANAMLRREIVTRKRAEEALSRANRTLKILIACNQAVLRATAEPALLQETCHIIVAHGGYPLAWAGYAERDAQMTVRPVAHAGFEEGYLDSAGITWADTEQGRGPAGTAIRSGAPSIARDIRHDPDFAPWREHSIRHGYASWIALPLAGENGVFGALNIYAAEPDAFDTQEVALLTELAGDIAFGIASLRARAERKRAEEAVRESEERWRRLVEHNPACIAVHSEGKLVYANAAGLRLIGATSLEQVLGKPILDFIHPDYRATVVSRVRQMMQDDLPAEPIEEKFLRLDGRTIDVEVTGIPTTYLGKRAIVTVNWDLTGRNRAEEALRMSEERYRQFFELDLTADFITTVDGMLTMCNPAYVRLFGFVSREQALRTNVRELYPNRESRAEFIRLVKQKRTITYHEMELRRRDGTPLYVVANLVGMFDDKGELESIQGYLFDETPRKLLEQQLVQAQKMEAIGRLAGGVAHDFNNMLGVILGVADLTLAKLSPVDPLRRRLETIKNAATRSSDITRQLLAFARKQAIEPMVLNLNSAISSMRKVLARLVGEDLDVVMLPGDLLWNIRIDPVQFDVVLANLATNARDAIEGVGRIVIETANASLDDEYRVTHIESTPGEYVMLSFSDTGKGMDKATLDRIFEPFFTTKPAGQGTGLGLSTIYGIVKQNGGFISVYSEPGRGTTFKIFFPRFTGDAVAVTVAAEELVLTGSETVLVVEDEAQLLDLTRMTLEEYGYSVLTASTPGDAILASEKYPDEIHMLVTDVVMPKMNGKELRERIERGRPLIRTLFMSGYTSNVVAHLGVLEEGVQFIQKPFTPRALATKVRQVLDQ